MIACLLLSAGSSERFGTPKALAQMGGEYMIVRLQKELMKSQIGQIIVVLGDHLEAIKPHLLNHKKVEFVYNKDYKNGQTSSFKAGLKNVASHARGIMLFPVDVPFVKATTIDFLIEEFLLKKPGILIPAYKNRNGHPPIFSSRLKNDLLSLDDSQGLNAFEQQHKDQTIFVPVTDPAILYSFNTPQEFDAVKNLIGKI